jgi:hypothetical protein
MISKKTSNFFPNWIAEANDRNCSRINHWRKTFTGTFANFSTGRVYDQIQSVAYSEKM